MNSIIQGGTIVTMNRKGAIKTCNSHRRRQKADFAMVDFEKPHLTPVYNETSHFVCSAKRRKCGHNYCKGQNYDGKERNQNLEHRQGHGAGGKN